jgi:putative endopeptidase
MKTHKLLKKMYTEKHNTKKTKKKCLEAYKPFEKELGKKYNKNYIVQKELIKIFNTPYAPAKFSQRSDFYSYINYSWLTEQDKIANSQEKKFYSQIDSFRVVQEKVYYELIAIVKDFVKKNKHSTKSKNLISLYNSIFNNDWELIKGHINETIDKINNLVESENVLDLLAFLNKNEIISWQAPLVFSIESDDKDSTIYRCKISQPQLSLYDYTLYIEDRNDDQNTKKYKNIFKKKYLKFISDIFDSCLGKNHGLKPEDVWEIEYRLLQAMGCNKIKKDSDEYYNKVFTSESTSYGLNWEVFSKKLGFTNTPSFYISTGLNYQSCIIEELNKNWKSVEWVTYYKFIYLKQMIRFDNKLRYIYFDFFGKFVNGQQIIFPQEIYPIFGLSLCFNTFLTKSYVRNNQNDEIIEYVESLGGDLLEVFKRILRRNNWLSPQTKKYALLKLKKIKLIIAKPDKLRDDPLITYDNKDSWSNMLKITNWRYNELLKLEGKSVVGIDIPIIDWNQFKLIGTQAYVVNAYYTPIKNSIYVPLGYLQRPFIDLNERGIEYNLSHIGYTLAHEMSHCLDDMGSKYDFKGNLKNWWTPKDKNIFNNKVKDVIKQYETFAGYDGIKMDASLSTGENLADISGLAICTEFLRDFQIKNKDINPISYISFEAFFIYIAIANRQKIYDEAIKSQLKINPHPMDKYRTNCPLTRLKVFQSMYNIKKGDKMYWSNTDTIW